MIYHTVLNNKQKIYSDWLQDDVINLGDATFVIPPSYQYEILEVTEKYVARPDLLSKDIYGDAIYSDLLCKLNGISNPFELNEHALMIIPSPDCIMDFMHVPTSEECDSDIASNAAIKPIAKQKSQKRKANEAVTGDSRFSLDRTKGIVIY